MMPSASGIEMDSLPDEKLPCRVSLEEEKVPSIVIEALAASIGEEIDTIEDVYEPYLIQIGFIARTPRGRVPLPPAYAHMGFEYAEK